MNKFKVGDLVRLDRVVQRSDDALGLIESFWLVGMYVVEYQILWVDGQRTYETEGCLVEVDNV